MSDNLQMQGSPPQLRAKARYATSCTECRRRKQKCNQGRPCSNCVRRFPQPTCEYTTRTIKRPTGSGTSSTSNVKVVLEGDAYAHLDLAELQDAILQLEGVGPPSGMLPTGPAATQKNASDAPEDRDSEQPEAFRIVVSDETGMLKPKSVLAMLRLILQARLNVTNRIVNDEWSIDGAQLMRAVQQAARPPTMVGTLDDQLRNLPMAHSRLNIELVRIHLQLLSRFKASLDGNPDPESRFLKHWVPMSIKDPLLLQIVLYTAACFLHETGRIPKLLVWAYKGGVHRVMNEHLSSPSTQTGDSAIMAAAQMVMDSWYWGTTEELRAHMSGLKTMIQMRGGLQELGMGGILAKTVIIHDISIALAHDVEPDIYSQPGFEFQDDFRIPYQVSFNSPLLSDWPPFYSPASLVRIHPSSAQILDDVRSIIKAVVSLPPSPTAEEIQDVKDAANWAMERLNQMPLNVPVESNRRFGRMADEGDDCMWETTGYEGAANSPDSTNGASSPRNGPPSSAGTPPSQGSVETTGMSPESVRSVPPRNDLMYRCIRKTAWVYYRAIIDRVPTTDVLSDVDFLSLWELVWEVSVATWKTVAGIFIWVMVAAVPSSHQSPPARFIKTLSVVGYMTMGLENWHVAIDAAHAALKLQKWLREGRDEDVMAADKAVSGGESIVDKHGFILREAHLPEVLNVRYDEHEEHDEHELDIKAETLS